MQLIIPCKFATLFLVGHPISVALSQIGNAFPIAASLHALSPGTDGARSPTIRPGLTIVSVAVAAINVLRHTVPVKANATWREAQAAIGLDFVLIELDLGVTFCERALSTGDEETKERNIRNARTAHAAALHFSQRLSLARAEQALIKEKESRLKGLFERLGING
jgi:hypothetical protein